MNIKIIYYTDIDDNTKGTLCAIPSYKDLRDSNVIDFIAATLHDSGILRPYFHDDCKEVANGIAYHESYSIGEYEFGVEEIPLWEC
jgi:hypothetical protein